MTEFEIISRYFSQPVTGEFLLAQGDDCALFDVPSGYTLAFSIDTLVEGRHFPSDYPAEHVATRALGCALSDLAAMGAEASHFTLAMTLPEFDEAWIKDFSQALYAMAKRFGVSLVGGDTTRGPLALSVQVHGLIPQGKSLRRSGAKLGDLLFVSGCLGDAAGGLKLLNNSGAYRPVNELNIELESKITSEHERSLRKSFDYPVPRLQLACLLRDKARACIDISDGFLADAEHLAEASGLTALIDIECLPISPALRETWPDEYEAMALSGGDDYELLCAVPKGLEAWALSLGLLRVGELVAYRAQEHVELHRGGLPYEFVRPKGYLHFD